MDNLLYYMPFSSIVQIKGKFSVILKKILANGKKNILWKVDFNSVLIHSFVFHLHTHELRSLEIHLHRLIWVW
jgi:hypothetical protein